MCRVVLAVAMLAGAALTNRGATWRGQADFGARRAEAVTLWRFLDPGAGGGAAIRGELALDVDHPRHPVAFGLGRGVGEIVGGLGYWRAGPPGVAGLGDG